MSEDQITISMQYIDKSLERVIQPVHDSIDKLFGKVDVLSREMGEVKSDIRHYDDRLEESATAFLQCQENCNIKMKSMRDETDGKISEKTTTSSKEVRQRIEIWIYRAALLVSYGALAYILAKTFDKIK